MRSIGVRYLVPRRLKSRTIWYWQPTRKLLAAGFLPRRLSDQLPEAIRQADKLNAELDAWYAGAPLQPRPAWSEDSLLALDALFQVDQAFTAAIGERSRRDYLYAIKPALQWAGEMPARAITRKAVKAWYRGQVAQRGAANARNAISALRRLLSFGCDEGWLSVNPALAMRVAGSRSRARVWTVTERDAFCAAAIAGGRPSMALAVMLGWCLGQRPSDLRRLPWSAYDGAAVALRQAKTGSAVWVPCLPELRRLLDSTRRVGVLVVVSEATGRPYAESDFQHRFAAIRAAADLPADLQFRDLRRTLATALGAAGCTDDQIRSITGHKTRGVVAVYVRPDRTFAEGAMKRLQTAGRNEKRRRS